MADRHTNPYVKLYLPQTLLDELRRTALQYNIPMQTLMRVALTAHLKTYTPPQAPQ